MRRILFLASVLASACSTAPPSEGNDRYGPVRGESVLSIGGSIQDSSYEGGDLNDLEETELNASLSYGYFLANNHELGAELVYSQVDSNFPGFDAVRFDGSAFYNFNIRVSSRTWIYLGPDAGFSHTDADSLDGSSTEPLYGGHLGVRLWATPTASVFLEPTYRRRKLDLDSGSVDQDTFGILFGVEFVL